LNRSAHWIDTWRKLRGEDGDLWPRDALLKSLPTARTMLYKYNSSPALGSGNEHFVEEAAQFLEALWVERHEVSTDIVLFGLQILKDFVP
jgi:hypothetical protein